MHLGLLLASIGTDPYRFHQTVGDVLQYSLLTRNSRKHTLSISRLLQAVLYSAMSLAEQKRWGERIIRALDSIFPMPEVQAWSDCERFLPHALACCAHAVSLECASLALDSLGLKIGAYFVDRAGAAQLEPVCPQSLQLYERASGLHRLKVNSIVNRLVACYKQQGNDEQAEPLDLRVLQSYQQELVPIGLID